MPSGGWSDAAMRHLRKQAPLLGPHQAKAYVTAIRDGTEPPEELVGLIPKPKQLMVPCSLPKGTYVSPRPRQPFREGWSGQGASASWCAPVHSAQMTRMLTAMSTSAHKG